MVGTEKVRDILEQLTVSEDFYVVDIKVSSSKIRNKIVALIDTDSGILVDHCSRVSRLLAEQLDEQIEDAYTLEVSSPGVDTPLKLQRQYVKNIGKELKVVLTDGSDIVGELCSVSDTGIAVMPEKKKKQKEAPVEIQILFDDIKEARVQVSFK